MRSCSIPPAQARHVSIAAGRLAANCLPENMDISFGGAFVDFGNTTLGRPIAWWDRDVIDDADGIISPFLLPEDRVTLRLTRLWRASRGSRYH